MALQRWGVTPDVVAAWYRDLLRRAERGEGSVPLRTMEYASRCSAKPRSQRPDPRLWRDSTTSASTIRRLQIERLSEPGDKLAFLVGPGVEQVGQPAARCPAMSSA
jgi:hypothetical protein